MSIAYVGGSSANDDAGGNALSLSSGYTVTAGSMLVCVWRHYHNQFPTYGTPTVTITDDKGNTWHTVPEVDGTFASSSTEGMRQGAAYCMNAAPGATVVTMTIAGPGAYVYRGFSVLEYSGAALASAFEDGGYGANYSSIATPAFDTAGEAVAVAFANTLNNANIGNFGSPVIGGVAATVRSLDPGAYIYDRIMSTPQSGITATVTQANGAQAVVLSVAAFKVASAVAPSTPRAQIMWWQ